MMSAHSLNVSHFSPLPVPPETSWSLPAMSAGSVEFAASDARARSTTASYDSFAYEKSVSLELPSPTHHSLSFFWKSSGVAGPAGVVPLAPSMLTPAGHLASEPKFFRLPSTRYSWSAG